MTRRAHVQAKDTSSTNPAHDELLVSLAPEAILSTHGDVPCQDTATLSAHRPREPRRAREELDEDPDN